MESTVSTRETVGRRTGRVTIDEQIADGIGKRLTARLATHLVGIGTPVINDIVDILVFALHLKIARFVITQQHTIHRDIISLNQSTCRVLHQSLAYNTVLNRYVVRSSALVVPVDGEILVLSPSKGTMVENHIAAISQSCTVSILRPHGTHAESHVAHDNVGSPRARHAVTIDRNTLAWCRLSSNSQIALEHQS